MRHRTLLLTGILILCCSAVWDQKVKERPGALDALICAKPELWLTVQPENPEEAPGLVPGEVWNGWSAFQADQAGQWRMIFDRVMGGRTLMEGKGIHWIPGAGYSLICWDLGIDPCDEGKNVPVEVVALKELDLLAAHAGFFGAVVHDLVLNKVASGRSLDYLLFIDNNNGPGGLTPPVETFADCTAILQTHKNGRRRML